MDAVEEKANTLSRCGSFYYSTLVDASKEDAEFVSHLTWQSRFPAQLQNILTTATGASHFRDFYRLIQFTDHDVNWRGMQAALQVRSSVPATNPQIADYNNRYPDYHLGDGQLMQAPGTVAVLADSETQALLASTPDAPATLPGTTKLYWELKIDSSVLVLTLRTPEGKIWTAGQEFASQFGKLTFTENPLHLFPELQFMAESCIVRKPSVFNHMLRLGSVYGVPDRVLHYYRFAQTPKTFYLATAQAAGLAVIRDTCQIIGRAPLQQGYIYSTTSGIYEAPYKHARLEEGTVLEEGHVIGGQELFQICGPGTELPPSVTRIELGTAVPVPGLSVTQANINIWNGSGQYRPAYEGSAEAVAAWYAYLEGVLQDGGATGGTGDRLASYPPANEAILQAAIQPAIEEIKYDVGEPCGITFKILTPNGRNTYNIFQLADDYYLISQDGNYIGLSASPTAMQDANGSDPGWAPSTLEADEWGGTINVFRSDSRIYGWISRNAAGNTGVSGALPVANLNVDIQYRMNSYNPDGLYIELRDDAFNVIEVLYMNIGVFDLHKLVQGYATTRVSAVISVDSIGDPISEPGIQHFRNTACANRCLVACINEADMSTEMKLRAMEFMRRELPIGSVLVTADMSGSLPEPDPEPEPEPEPEPITVVSTGVPTATTFDRSNYHAMVLRVSDSAGFIAWNPELNAGAATKLRSITIRCASNTSNPEGTTATVRVAVYQADEGRFMGVSNVAHTWTQDTKKKFTFAEDLPIKLTDRLMFVYVAPEATIEELINPMMTGLDVGADDLTLSAWRTELRKTTYPTGWGVITSASLSSPNNGYIFDLELELVQQV